MRLAIAIAGASLLCVGCASAYREVRVASLETTTPVKTPAVKDGPEHVATTAVLTTVGGGLAVTGMAMLVCAGGGLGCFSGASYATWAHHPKIEQVVLAVSGAVVFSAGAMTLLMVPIWLAIGASEK